MCGHGMTEAKDWCVEGPLGLVHRLPRLGVGKRAVGDGRRAAKRLCSNYRNYNLEYTILSN